MPLSIHQPGSAGSRISLQLQIWTAAAAATVGCSEPTATSPAVVRRGPKQLGAGAAYTAHQGLAPLAGVTRGLAPHRTELGPASNGVARTTRPGRFQGSRSRRSTQGQHAKPSRALPTLGPLAPPGQASQFHGSRIWLGATHSPCVLCQVLPPWNQPSLPQCWQDPA